MNENNIIFSLEIIVIILVILGVVWWVIKHIMPSDRCSIGDPGSCNLDSDCNGPTNGACYKNANGQCQCVCNPGYSGLHCEIKGIPWNSPQCMGPNTQWPARKDKNVYIPNFVVRLYFI